MQPQNIVIMKRLYLSTYAYVYDPEVNRLETSEEYCRRKDISYDPKTYEREKIKCENEVDEEEW